MECMNGTDIEGSSSVRRSTDQKKKEKRQDKRKGNPNTVRRGKKKVESKETAQDSGTQLEAFFDAPLSQPTVPFPRKIFRVRIIQI